MVMELLHVSAFDFLHRRAAGAPAVEPRLCVRIAHETGAFARRSQSRGWYVGSCVGCPSPGTSVGFATRDCPESSESIYPRCAQRWASRTCTATIACIVSAAGPPTPRRPQASGPRPTSTSWTPTSRPPCATPPTPRTETAAASSWAWPEVGSGSFVLIFSGSFGGVVPPRLECHMQKRTP